MGYLVVAVVSFALGYVAAQYGVDVVGYVKGLFSK